MTLILREADVLRVIDMDEVIAAVTAAMKELGEGTAQNEPRRRAFATGAIFNVMFAAFPGGDCMGTKSYTVASNTVRFLATVFGLDGTLRALIEADHMGAYRTGAATGVAAKALARPGPVVVGLIGSGHQAETQALALGRALRSPGHPRRSRGDRRAGGARCRRRSDHDDERDSGDRVGVGEGRRPGGRSGLELHQPRGAACRPRRPRRHHRRRPAGDR